MAEYVEAGILSNLGKALSGLWKKILNSDKVKRESGNEPIYDDSGVEIGYLSTIQLKNDHEVKAKVISTNKENKTKPPFNVYILSDTGEKESFEDLKSNNEVEKSVALFIDSYWDKLTPKNEGAENSQEVEEFNKAFGQGMAASKKIQVTLSKIHLSEDIRLDAVYANYDPVKAFNDLETILEAPEILDEITERPTSLEIVPYEDDYSVTEISEITPMNSVSEILKMQLYTLYALYSRIASVSSMECNPQTYTNMLTWQIEFMLSPKLAAGLDVSELIKEIDWSKLDDTVDTEQLISDYATTLDLYYPNFDHEVQKLLDDWLLSLRYNRY